MIDPSIERYWEGFVAGHRVAEEECDRPDALDYLSGPKLADFMVLKWNSSGLAEAVLGFVDGVLACFPREEISEWLALSCGMGLA